MRSPILPLGLALAATVLGACAASRAPERAAEPAPVAPALAARGPASAAAASTAPPPIAAPLASASANASASASTASADLGCEPSRVEVPEPFRALFQKGRRTRYAAVDDVDPHAPQGGRIVERSVVVCEVRALRRFRTAVGSELVCNLDPPQASGPAMGRLAFLANDRGLWRLEALPDEAGAATAVARPPLVPTPPKASTRTFEEPGMFEGVVHRCTAKVEITARGACAVTSCKVPVGYGDTEDRICFARDRGLETLRRVNLAGPATTSWRFLDGGAADAQRDPPATSTVPSIAPPATSTPPSIAPCAEERVAPSAGAPAPARSAQPEFERLAGVLCKAAGVDANECSPAAFDASPTTLDSASSPAWVFVNKKGPAQCFVRAACFTVIERGPHGWRVVLSGMGELLHVAKTKLGTHADLVVGGANSSCEMVASRHVWTAGAYREARRETCRCDAKTKSRLCSMLDEPSIALE